MIFIRYDDKNFFYCVQQKKEIHATFDTFLEDSTLFEAYTSKVANEVLK